MRHETDISSGSAQKLGDRGQNLVRHILSSGYGRRTHIGRKVGRGADPWDILVDGRWRIEVKTAKPHRADDLLWKFNIHRHGMLDESKVDFYVLRLEQVPYSKAAIHLLFESPLKTYVFQISFRRLLNGLGKYAEAFREFAKTGENPFIVSDSAGRALRRQRKWQN